MTIEVAIWRVDKGVNPVSLSGMDYEQRLQEVIAADIAIIDPSLMIVGREVASSLGSIDVLAIDAEGSLVVIELKRAKTPREVVAQVLDYGSWVRYLTSEEIADTFISYQTLFLDKAMPIGINEALQERFNGVPEELNTSHRLLIVAESLDASTERIVSYLRDEHHVDINVVLFRAFEDEGRRYLTRAWLNDPVTLPTEGPSKLVSKGDWNGEFYVSFGEGPHRRWNDAKQYGFVSAGGGEWYTRTLSMLQPGNRVWVSVPRKGYVGVGNVVEPATRFDNFSVDLDGIHTPVVEVELEAPEVFDEQHGEHFVGIKWIKVVDLHEAVRERGFFGNQNTVAQPRSPKWDFTIERLKSKWGVD